MPIPSRVLGVLAGRPLPKALLREWADSAQVVLAADGGADGLLAVGATPDIVVGDLDSLKANLDDLPDVRRQEDQYSTDCDKLLALAGSLGIGAITLVGVEGDLPDHELATLQSCAKTPLRIRLVYRRGFGTILKGPQTVIAASKKRVSLIPITECVASLSGVRWPIDSARLAPLGANSISNEATELPIRATVHEGVALLFVEARPKPWWDE